jgi:hypothetical protein
MSIHCRKCVDADVGKDEGERIACVKENQSLTNRNDLFSNGDTLVTQRCRWVHCYSRSLLVYAQVMIKHVITKADGGKNGENEVEARHLQGRNEGITHACKE